MIDAFQYALPTEIVFGFGKLEELPALLESRGVQKCVLVCDRFFKEKGETLKATVRQVCAVFSDVELNPQLACVEETVRLLQAHGADAVLALGGGSAMDTAKFAAACAKSARTPNEHFDGAPFAAKGAAVFAVPTTAGTGAEVTGVAVISRGAEKKTIHHPSFYPDVCIVDPALTLTVPPFITMITGLDAFTHAIEAFWSVRHSAVTDLFATEAMKAILANLEDAFCAGGKAARTGMAYGSLLAGLAFSNAKTAACHACSYPLSMYHHLPHGEACAFTLDSFIRMNADARLEGLAKTLGFESCGALAEEIARLKELGGLRTRLSQCEGEIDLDRLANESASHMLMRNNPVQFSAAELRKMFEALV